MTKPAPRFADTALQSYVFAVRTLGWTPDIFWHATPQELACLLAADLPSQSAGLDRAALNAMMEHDNER